MNHVIAGAILALGILSPFYLVCVATDAMSADKKTREVAKRALFQFLSMLAGVLLTSALSFLFYCF